MNTSPTPAASGPSASNVSVQNLTERLNRASQSISQHEANLSSAAKLMGIVGFLVLIALAIYFHFGYRMIAELLEPKKLVPLGAQMLNDRLPEARQALVKQVADSAPAWAEQLSAKSREAIPEARLKLEEYVITETDKLLSQATSVTEEKFRAALHENHDVVEKGLKELAADQKLSEESLNALVVALEQQLQTDMQVQSETVLDTLRFLRSRVQKLAHGQGLDDEEKIERRVLMINRRLQLMEADPRPIATPVIAKSPSKAEVKEDSEAKSATDDKPDEASKPSGGKDDKAQPSDAGKKADGKKPDESNPAADSEKKAE